MFRGSKRTRYKYNAKGGSVKMASVALIKQLETRDRRLKMKGPVSKKSRTGSNANLRFFRKPLLESISESRPN